MAERRVIHRHTVSLGTTEITFPSHATVLSVGEVRSDLGPGPTPEVWVWVLTFEGGPSPLPDKHVFTVVRTGDTVPWTAGEFVGSVPENWDMLHVYDKRVGL